MVIDRLIMTMAIALAAVAIYWAVRSWNFHLARKVSTGPVTISSSPTIMYFRSDSCAPCLTQNHYLKDLETTYGSSLTIHKIDADVDRDLAGQYGIFTLPTTLVLDRKGEVQYINYGLTATSRLVQQMEKVI